MKFKTATFRFEDEKTVAHVVFNRREGYIHVSRGIVEHNIDNSKATYKPCITHCLELLAQLAEKRPRNNFSKRRQKNQRPSLAIRG